MFNEIEQKVTRVVKDFTYDIDSISGRPGGAGRSCLAGGTRGALKIERKEYFTVS